MLTAEKNKLLTEVGPTTKMGQLLRRYWHPVAGVSEFEKKPIKPIKLLGEELVLYKTLQGAFGLVARRCAHRGSDLTYGIVEDDGLRCSYHGWQYDRTGQCTHQPFEETFNSAAKLRKSTKISAYRVEAKAGMIWAYMGPEPAPLLPDWETFSWPNAFTQVVVAEVPCNWLQCQENTVDPVHFEWMHNNQPQRLAGDLGPYSPKTLKLKCEDTEYGLLSRRYREGNDETAPLWSVGRAILWPNGWYFGHHFEWKVPIDDENTLFVNWCSLHVPTENEPYVQERIPTWHAPTKDAGGEWITSHVSNQDVVAWVSQGRIADRTSESLGASDVGVVMMRQQFLSDLQSIEQGKDPKGIIRDPKQNTRIELPCVAREDLKSGLPRAEMEKHPVMAPFLHDFFLLAGQPDDVKKAFEDAMGAKQKELRVHELVFR